MSVAGTSNLKISSVSGGAVLRPELVSGGVAAAAIIMFVGTGSQVMGGLSTLRYAGPLPAAALILNIALILFAWWRHRDACAEAAMRRVAEDKAQLLSTRDQLTDMLVRSSIVEAARELLCTVRDAGQSMAMIVVNLDRFKYVNEVYGHLAGDGLLRSAADIIAEEADSSALCARVGADEFCIAYPFVGGCEKDVTRLADRLIQRLNEPFEMNGVEIHVSASGGVARLDGACADVESLLRRAGIAMNSAKKAGGSRVMWFDASMESVLKARNEVEAGLRRGIGLGEFLPYYQPQVDLRTGEVRGFEALARWNHPAGGVVGPDVFIPVAEETGLIGPLFESIFAQALEAARGWDSALTLSVNISPGQLKDPWLPQKIVKLLTESGFPPERLEIEITESSLFENLALAQVIVESLKNQGVRLALDDFGTGYSSLANLRALPFDRIKIDRSFVQSMERDRESLAIVTAIAKMGESLGVPVTAEGVGSTDVAGQLVAIGCDMGQGWLYGKPMLAAEALALLAENAGLANAATVRAAAAWGTLPPLPSQRKA